jgi:EmrB/QacA subfamily drug resistance transporter
MSTTSSTSSSSEAALAPPSVLRPGLPLAVVVAMSCLAQFMVVLDSAIVTLALPQMRAGLGLSTSDQQWVLSGYLITLGGFLLLAARAGDLFGRKRLFLFGAVVFTAASLAGGLATDPAMLLTARVIQGVGAAALAPTSLSLITATHTDEKQRQRALLLWSIMGGLAGVAGIILGGVLTAELNWRWVLFINVPLGLALLAATMVALLPAQAADRASRTRLDVTGALTATGGIGALTYGLSQASSNGWGSTSVVIGLVCAGVLLLAFVAVEATGSQPLIPPALFRLRGLSVGNLLMLCMGATMTAAFFVLSLYLQEVVGYSALRAGMALLPTTVIMIAGGVASSRLMPVTGPRPLLLAGGLVTAASLAWLTMAPVHPAYAAHILGPALLAGIGMGLMLLPITLSGTNGVPPKDAGAAAGLLNSARQVGGALGLAALVNIAATATSHAHAGYLGGLVHGYHVAFGVNAAIMVAVGLLALALPAARRATAGAVDSPQSRKDD